MIIIQTEHLLSRLLKSPPFSYYRLQIIYTGPGTITVMQCRLVTFQ